MKTKLIFTILILCILNLNAQKFNPNWFLISQEIKENANACFILNQNITTISSQNTVNYKEYKVVAIFNQEGHESLSFIESYSKNRSIKNLEATIYNATGGVIKKFKEKDFKDYASQDGITILSDDRLKILDYTPTTYPYYIEYNSEISSSNTAFIPDWQPIRRNFVSILKDEYEIIYPDDLGFRKKEANFEGFLVKKEESTGKIKYILENIKAYKPESYADNFDKYTPVVQFALTNFHLEGINGKAENWNELSNWINQDLLKDTEELPVETIDKIKQITANEKDIYEKVKKVYEYVQNKTRYISIQLGIGGWKPMLAKDVDRLGYGDCKALSNYTRVLLKYLGIPSYYTIVYGDDSLVDIDNEFVSLQGNHVILAIPIDNNIKWLECTNQTCPADFSAGFTDNRKVFIIKPDGSGEIIKTKNYNENLNQKNITGEVNLDENLGFTSAININSQGIYYGEKYRLEKESTTEIEKFYKNEWRNIQEVTIEKEIFENKKSTAEIVEKLKISSPNYSKKMGNNLIFIPNFFQNDIRVPNRIKTRVKPFILERGFQENQNINIKLPAGYKVEFVPENIKNESKFGVYEIKYSNANSVLTYTRKLTIFQNKYEKSEFEAFRLFLDEIARQDNAKVSLIKN